MHRRACLLYNIANALKESCGFAVMTDFGNTLYIAWLSLTRWLRLADVADILVLTIIFYYFILLIRQTRGSAIIKGLIVLLITTVVSVVLFKMNSLLWLMRYLFTYGPLVLVVLFQPELRKALESLGRNRLLVGHRRQLEEDERERVIHELIQCMQDLSRRRVGALMVIERETGLQDIIETGTAVDSRISAPLLENIFEPNTPLHDGAVIIRDTRVVAAACILPLTESETVSRDLGTRHRASIGISETTDAVALIVSEETGVMSVARGGRLVRHQDEESLHRVLSELYADSSDGLRAVFRRKKKEAERA